MRKIIAKMTLVLLSAAFVFSTSHPGISGVTKNRTDKNRSLAKITVTDRPLWVPNRIGTYISNDGYIVDYHPTGSSGMEWPVGSGNFIHFTGGMWLAGVKNGEIVTASTEFSTEFQPGTVSQPNLGVEGVAANPQDAGFHVYIITQADASDPLKNPDYANWPAADGAPVNSDGSPALVGTSMAWAVYNDFNESLHTNLFETKIMGIEQRMTAWGFNRPDAFGDMIFVKFEFVNKSGTDITNAYVSSWNDIDVGDALDLIGCDIELSLGFNYKTNADGAYGANAPAIGLDFFQGPIVPSPGDIATVSGVQVFDFKNLEMTSFAKYINGGPPQLSDPETGPEAYNFMQGFDLFGDPVVNPLTNQETKFWHDGDPGTGTGWLDDDHRDKRFLMSAGPFTLADGDAQELVMGMIIAQGATGVQSVDLVKRNDAVAQLAYDINFALPPSPPNPTVEVAPEEQSIYISWDNSAEDYEAEDRVDIDENGDPTMYTFQGYNVYQLDAPSITAETTIKKIASFDALDGVIEIRDDVFLADLGQVANIVVEDINDSGVQRWLRINADALAGNAPLIQNRQYYFAVTAFGYNPNGIPKVLESPMDILTIRPQSQPLGGRLTTIPGDSLTVTHIGPGDGVATAVVVNPSDLKGQDFTVSFRDDGGIVWDVAAGGVTKVTGWVNQGEAGNGDFPVVDGVFIQVFGPPLGINTVAREFEGGPRWISGTNWGGSHLFGGLDINQFFFGSVVPATDYRVYDWKFTSNPTMSEATGWMRCYTYRRDLGYPAAGIGWAPFQVFDVSDEANPRQVNVVFVEDAANGLADLIWNPIAAGAAGTGLGGREYTFLMSSDYDPDAGIYDDVNWGPAADVVYVLWPNTRGSHPFQESDFTLRITPNFVNLPADNFTFSSVGAVKGDAALAKTQAANLLNVYPNPYNGFNIEERDPANRFVTFTHLPEGAATIQIFTLAGELIRTIDHTTTAFAGTQFDKWDLRNFRDIPVASGMYLARIVGDFGVKILKLAILQTEERLDVF